MVIYSHKLHIQQAEAGGLLPEQYETLYQRKGGEENKKKKLNIVEAKFCLVFTLLI